MEVENKTPEAVKEETQAQLGAEMAPEAPKKPEDVTMEEKTISAVQYLHVAIPAARNMIEHDLLTGTQAKRVLMALIEAPLEKETPEFTTLEAKKVFHIACMIQNAKYILFQGAPQLLSEVEKEAALAKSTEEAKTENNNEGNNDGN